MKLLMHRIFEPRTMSMLSELDPISEGSEGLSDTFCHSFNHSTSLLSGQYHVLWSQKSSPTTSELFYLFSDDSSHFSLNPDNPDRKYLELEKISGQKVLQEVLI
jgi:hypothetical protein